MRTNELAHEISRETIEYRRDIHQHPEASMHEFRTTDRICEELDKLGVNYKGWSRRGSWPRSKVQKQTATN